MNILAFTTATLVAVATYYFLKGSRINKKEKMRRLLSKA